MSTVPNVNMIVGVAPKLRDALRGLAASKGLSLAAYTRMAILAYPEVSEAMAAPIIAAPPQPKTVEPDIDISDLEFVED